MHLLSSTLQITEIFESVQGETTLTGIPTTFIRLAGCPLRCTWCDTSYSFGRGVKREIGEILMQVDHFGWRHVCVTGGEPLAQHRVLLLIAALCDRNYLVSLETAGSLPIEEVDARAWIILDVKCPGSGMESKNRWENLVHLKEEDEIKFVLRDQQDYEYAKQVCKERGLLQRRKAPLFSPVHGELDPKTLVSWILSDHLPVRLNLQIHKYVWTPCTRGV
jgi:7-carboxy-7-deazaguanine synthase